ncbi:reverse [Fusarium longipes]|uniref:Reverse n=1 Tax=Fusarium longipes TaxID=694270 RepID=A0A395SD87_9HYPO|nr:reverse [Fusarium longipes]
MDNTNLRLLSGIVHALERCKLAMTTAYHPEAYGISERRNQTVKIALRFHYIENPLANWSHILLSLHWNSNGAINVGTGMSALEYIYGFKPASARGYSNVNRSDNDLAMATTHVPAPANCDPIANDNVIHASINASQQPESLKATVPVLKNNLFIEQDRHAIPMLQRYTGTDAYRACNLLTAVLQLIGICNGMEQSP